MRLEDVMTRSAVVIRPGQTLALAVQRMLDHRCGFLPVVRDDGRVVGVLTDRDICLGAHARSRPLHEIEASDVMVTGVVTGRLGDSLGTAENLMRLHGIRRLPVLDERSALSGIVSLDDLIRHAVDSGHPSLQREALRTYVAVSGPRRGVCSTRPSDPSG